MRANDVCETPKSPPGDYNGGRTSTRRPRRRRTCVKHLNPRQGITTVVIVVIVPSHVRV